MQNDSSKFKIFIVFFLLLFTLLPFRSSLAQVPGEGLTISPPLFELNLKEGETSSQTIKITNPTESLVEVYPLVMNFKASGESGEPAFYPATSEEEKFSLAKWITFNQTKIALTPEQVVEFKFQIKVPSDAEPGGHYGVVFFATEPPQLEKDISQVAIASMIGSLILGKTPGEIIEKGVLEEFIAGRFYFKKPIKFTTRIQNTGNIHFKPQGEIMIKDWRGKIVEKVAVNSAKGNVLPDSTRKFEESWTPQKWYTVGRFKADLKLTYGESNQSLNGKLIFWIIPWWLITVLVILILALAFLLWRYFHRRRKIVRQRKRIILQ